MKKYLIYSVLALFCMAVFFPACSKEDDEPEPEKKEQSNTNNSGTNSGTSTNTSPEVQYGTIVIKHDSSKPYDFFIDNKLEDQWTKPGTNSYLVTANVEHTIKVVQTDGYLFNPTKGEKKVTVKPGEKKTFSGPKSNTSVEYFNE